MQRWSKGLLRGDSLPKVTEMKVKLGHDPEAQLWSPCHPHSQSPGECLGLQPSGEVPGTCQRTPHTPSLVLAVPHGSIPTNCHMHPMGAQDHPPLGGSISW